MRVAVHGRIHEVDQRGLGTGCLDFANGYTAAKDVGDFGIQQMWGVGQNARCQNMSLDRLNIVAPQQPLEGCRGIKDDQRPSRSARTYPLQQS